MTIKDRLYWFTRNLFAFCLVIILSPVYFGYKNIMSLIGAMVILTVTDGSEEISLPHQWDWRN